MGHTNSTANLSLPQFIGTDKPTWLGDVNGAFSAIDSYVGTNDAAVAAAASDASSAISQAAAAVNTANTANTTAGNASTAATAAVTAANQANALSNQVSLRTGVLADLHTTDKSSIVNAINEVKDVEGDLTSLTTTDKTSLVAAINEVAQGGGGLSIIKTVTADGVKTLGQILSEFASELADIKVNSIFTNGDEVYHTAALYNNMAVFTNTRVSTTKYELYEARIAASGVMIYSNNGTNTDASSTVPTSGVVFNLYA